MFKYTKILTCIALLFCGLSVFAGSATLTENQQINYNLIILQAWIIIQSGLQTFICFRLGFTLK